MTAPIHHAQEPKSNADRDLAVRFEPRSLRTYTPSQAVLDRSAGVYHWTPEGRKLYDYSSGVLVANLGHNPRRWMQHFCQYMGWTGDLLSGPAAKSDEYFPAITLTAYNGVTEVETQAVQR